MRLQDQWYAVDVKKKMQLPDESGARGLKHKKYVCIIEAADSFRYKTGMIFFKNVLAHIRD